MPNHGEFLWFSPVNDGLLVEGATLQAERLTQELRGKVMLLEASREEMGLQVTRGAT